jgi:hypothetical protein
MITSLICAEAAVVMAHASAKLAKNGVLTA